LARIDFRRKWHTAVSLERELKFCVVINFENFTNSVKTSFIKCITLTLPQQNFCTVFGLTVTANEKSYLYSLHLYRHRPNIYLQTVHSKSSPVTGLEWPRGFQEVKVPR
jgi:hypothetical protein